MPLKSTREIDWVCLYTMQYLYAELFFFRPVRSWEPIRANFSSYHSEIWDPRFLLFECTWATMGTTVHYDLDQEVTSFLSDPCADLYTLNAPNSECRLSYNHLSKPIKGEVHWLALWGTCWVGWRSVKYDDNYFPNFTPFTPIIPPFTIPYG